MKINQSHFIATCGAILLLSVTLGCGQVGPGTAWLGIPSACKTVIESINSGTDWVLNKNQVSVVKVSEVKELDGGACAADFKISVTDGTNSFETTAKAVPCDKDGIPTEKSVDKLRESVEDIKAKIKRLQN